MAPVPFTDVEIEAALREAKGWLRVGDSITKTFLFETFRDALAFIVRVGLEAEGMDHHPTFYNAYNRVELTLCTHDAGRKITDKDIALALRINICAERWGA